MSSFAASLVVSSANTSLNVTVGGGGGSTTGSLQRGTRGLGGGHERIGQWRIDMHISLILGLTGTLLNSVCAVRDSVILEKDELPVPFERKFVHRIVMF